MATRLNGTAEVGGPGISPLAAALIQSGGGNNLPPDIQELIMGELREQLEQRQAAKRKKENQALANVQATAEALKHRDQEQNRCSHRKIDGQTRLAGQYLSGTGQLCLVCVYCRKEFFEPAQEGQNPVPPGLRPPADEIGG